ADGLPGPAGADGKDGADGLPGPAGADGKDGADGPQGPQGDPAIVQRVFYESCDVLSQAAQVKTIPLNGIPSTATDTQGTQFLPVPGDTGTPANPLPEITPTSATNLLQIDVHFNFGLATTGRATVVALFEQSRSDALKAGWAHSTNSFYVGQIVVRHQIDVNTTDPANYPLRFKVYAGPSTGSVPVVMNGRQPEGQLLGGALCSSITITELRQ
ncbi:MAG: hypothetical protein ACE5K1_07675, partial [Acidiferrobacterales bacterium]